MTKQKYDFVLKLKDVIFYQVLLNISQQDMSKYF